MKPDMQETFNVVGEILIGLATISGAFYLIGTHPTDPGIVGPSVGMATLVLTFWYSQRGSTKASNGSVLALAALATQIGSAQAQMSASQTQATVATMAAQPPMNAANPVIALKAETPLKVEGVINPVPPGEHP